MAETKNKLVNRTFFFWALIVFVCLVVQFFPVLNYVFTVLVFVFCFIGIYKRWPSALLPILSLSFLHGESSVSLYTLKIQGISVFYLLILSVTALKLVQRRTLSKAEIMLVVFFGIYFLYSILFENFYESKYFVKDALLFALTLLFAFIIYDFKSIDFDKLVMASSIGYYLAKIFVCLTEVGLETIPYSSGVNQQVAIFDPIENFFIIFNIKSFFYPQGRTFRLISAVNISLFLIASLLLGYIHGATLVLILISLVYCAFRNFKYLLVVPIILGLSLSFIYTSGLVLEEKESVFSYKLEKISGLFQFLISSDLSIYDLPRSTQVRMIESGNLLNQNPGYLIFGKGFGGYITELKYYYGDYLNGDDYTVDQINSGKYQVLHGYNQIILKHGLFSIFIAFIVFFKFRKKELRNFRDSSIIFVILSYSFTMKPYLILAMLLFSLTKGVHGEKR